MTTLPIQSIESPAGPGPAGPRTIRFLRRGEVVSLVNVPPTRTLLEVLREDLACTGTKEGCGEGDCGACTVVLAEPDVENGDSLRFRAINSCIRLAHSIDGMALWTVEDIAEDPMIARAARPDAEKAPPLHPAQEAMVQCHGSQCGFCTPGFVMSLFGMYQNRTCQGETITREIAQQDLSGNLCRCTGYRPILDAAQAMGDLPAARLDARGLLEKLRELQPPDPARPTGAYLSPTTLPALLQARAAHPAAQIVAGCTDVGLWVTKLHMQFAEVLDVTKVRELRRVESYPHHLAIGAAVTLDDAYAALVKDRPQLQNFAARFAGLPVRNSGTLGGNVANGSPIGDSMPLLIALGASIVLMSVRDGQPVSREMPLEALYTGYRKNVMAPDEVLAWIKVPTATPDEQTSVYKISKRYDDDISAVCMAIRLCIYGGIVTTASVGCGGVAATPVRAKLTEKALAGQPWTLETVQKAIATLRAEFSPISDMRASAAYRSQVLGNLLQRYWLESQGLQQINLATFRPDGIVEVA
ncbi:MAG: xanthine dehydrogenase small subunit [Comamonadaceae bacterium]|nr:MAG: xanthine dehydrogenase small subunit [Comamonadaceae bacterium]